ncbi:MAG: hypothetical protein JXQ73_09405 [Phycisphaerae bacterium]|nr:hypothetical protein [Phycisphaerae bacterium]
MGYFEDAKALVDDAAERLVELRKAYDDSLHEKALKSRLLIEIKNITENLRSALDFVAHGLVEKYGRSTRDRRDIYFPYARPDQTQAEFQRSGRIEKCIPGISSSRPDIVATLESYQHYARPDNRWLPLFMELNNENKHQRLTPQTREEARELTLESDGSSLSLGPGGSISLGPGARIDVGDMIIPGGQYIAGDSPAKFVGSGRQTVTIWVSFRFESNGELVMPFLSNAVDSIRRIVDELANV